MPASKIRSRTCQWCSQDFELGVDNKLHKYCSIGCRQKWHSSKFLTSKRDPLKTKDYQLRTKYGISLDQYNSMLCSQDFKCAICSTSEPQGYNWHVDHCHNTGKVRGILCCNCNQALGLLKENTHSLEKMIGYIKQHSN